MYDHTVLSGMVQERGGKERERERGKGEVGRFGSQ